MVQNYRERCRVRAVSAWRVDSEDGGRGLLQVTPPEYAASDATCEELGRTGEADVFLALSGRPEDSGCGDALSSFGTETRVVVGSDDAMPLDEDWVVAVSDTGDLVDADIGCAHWSVIFCDNPFTDHAWADLD